MKNLVIAFVALLSVNVFASEKMGDEAVEMFQVLSHHQVVECLRNAPNKMINISIEKVVAHCPGCTRYNISGYEVGIDTPRSKKTVITIKGHAVPGIGLDSSNPILVISKNNFKFDFQRGVNAPLSLRKNRDQD